MKYLIKIRLINLRKPVTKQTEYKIDQISLLSKKTRENQNSEAEQAIIIKSIFISDQSNSKPDRVASAEKYITL